MTCVRNATLPGSFSVSVRVEERPVHPDAGRTVIRFRTADVAVLGCVTPLFSTCCFTCVSTLRNKRVTRPNVFTQKGFPMLSFISSAMENPTVAMILKGVSDSVLLDRVARIGQASENSHRNLLLKIGLAQNSSKREM